MTTATQLASIVRNHADLEAAADRLAASNPESFVVGWLMQGLEDAYEVLLRCNDPAAKTFLTALKRRHSLSAH
jgi:hypothetical protein